MRRWARRVFPICCCGWRISGVCCRCVDAELLVHKALEHKSAAILNKSFYFLSFGRNSEQIGLNERIAWLRDSECEDMSSGGVLNSCCNLCQSSWCRASRSTWEMLSLSFLLFGQKSEQLGLNGRSVVVRIHLGTKKHRALGFFIVLI